MNKKCIIIPAVIVGILAVLIVTTVFVIIPLFENEESSDAIVGTWEISSNDPTFQFLEVLPELNSDYIYLRTNVLNTLVLRDKQDGTINCNADVLGKVFDIEGNLVHVNSTGDVAWRKTGENRYQISLKKPMDYDVSILDGSAFGFLDYLTPFINLIPENYVNSVTDFLRMSSSMFENDGSEFVLSTDATGHEVLLHESNVVFKRKE